jgi:hypothetical protein
VAKIPLPPEFDKIIKEQRKAFKKKFGRYPRPDEPLMFDPGKDAPQPLVMDVFRDLFQRPFGKLAFVRPRCVGQPPQALVVSHDDPWRLR